MIKCRTCSTSFPRPARRGRPPVQCDSCRGGSKALKASESPAEPSGDGTTPAKAVSSPSVPLKASKKRPYVSGFCNPRHEDRIHKLCSTLGGACTCGCHKAA